MKILKITLIVSFLIFLSCKSEMTCSEPSENIGRTNSLKLNAECEQSLNAITKILNWQHELKNFDKNSSVALIRTNEIYFNLNENNQNLYIKAFYYKDYLKEKKPNYNYYEVPINQLDPKNIEIEVLGLKQYENNSVIIFTSKFSNDKAFTRTHVLYDNDNNLQHIECVQTSSIDLLVKTEDAQILKDAFVNFLRNYKK